MKPFNFKSRNAVSTIIGTFFFLIIMAGAFTAFILMMQTNSNFLNTQLGVSQNEIEKIQGQFTIGAAYDKQTNSAGAIGNRLCVSVINSGSTPLEIADLFIENKTDHNAKQFDIDFRDAFVPASSIKQILANQPISLTSGTSGTEYNIKVVTTSGIAQTTELKVFPNSGTDNDPRINVTAFVYPPSASSGQNVTVGMQVFNRANTTLINVQPNGEPIESPDLSVPDGYPFLTHGNLSRLDPNEGAVFMWDPQFVGGVGSKISFTVRAKALVEGCTSPGSYIFGHQTTQILVVPGVKKQILASPDTFVTFPGPFGAASAGPGIFAVVVQNPTNKVFTVSQVAIQVVSLSATDFLRQSGCSTTCIAGVTPTIADWSQVGSTNVLTWKGTAVSIPPFDSREFIVRAHPKTSLSTSPINSIFFNVYSSFGQFGKGPFTFGLDTSNTGVVNVYSKSTFASTAPKFFIEGLSSAQTCQSLHFTIANNGSATVASAVGARPYLLINIPPGIRDIQDKDGNGIKSEGSGSDPCDTSDEISTGLTPKPLIEFDDGSNQKAVEISTALAAVEARTYTMTITLPTISVPTHYIFTLTANGTSASALLGPQSEIDVQVCPTSGATLCQ